MGAVMLGVMSPVIMLGVIVRLVIILAASLHARLGGKPI
jgi:hypothetical protein